MRNLPIIFLIIVHSCESNRKDRTREIETPLVSVIKLISAETTGNIQDAREYIDVEKVFSEHTSKSEDYNETYDNLIKFKSSGYDSRKFTSEFKYYNYEISEKIQGKKAIVSFISKNTKDRFTKITYFLEITNERWIVVSIDYEDSGNDHYE